MYPQRKIRRHIDKNIPYVSLYKRLADILDCTARLYNIKTARQTKKSDRRLYMQKFKYINYGYSEALQ